MTRPCIFDTGLLCGCFSRMIYFAQNLKNIDKKTSAALCGTYLF